MPRALARARPHFDRRIVRRRINQTHRRHSGRLDAPHAARERLPLRLKRHAQSAHQASPYFCGRVPARSRIKQRLINQQLAVSLDRDHAHDRRVAYVLAIQHDAASRFDRLKVERASLE